MFPIYFFLLGFLSAPPLESRYQQEILFKAGDLVEFPKTQWTKLLGKIPKCHFNSLFFLTSPPSEKVQKVTPLATG